VGAKNGFGLNETEIWPLAGRDDLLELIVDTSAQPSVCGVVLVGAPGVGKTRLAREACARLGRQGSQIAWATATHAAATVSFGAFPHLLPKLAQRAGALEVIQHFAERFSAPHERRPVLAIDDAHLLDSASIALVHHLARHGRGFLVLTALAGGPMPDALLALWKERIAVRVEVPPLAIEHVDAFLAGMPGDPFDAISRGRLRDLCAGNPLLLREMVNAGLETGTLRTIDGFRHWTVDADFVTDRLADVVESQSGASNAQIRSVLEVLACANPLNHALVERLTDNASLIEAERQQLISFNLSGGRLLAGLTVPGYGEVIRARMPTSRRRTIYRTLADALVQLPRRRADDILHLAHWRLLGGQKATPVELIAAARRAAALLDFPAAARLAIAARHARGGAAADLALAEILSAQGCHAEAATVLPSTGLDTRDRIRVGVLDALIRFWRPGSVPATAESAARKGLPAPVFMGGAGAQGRHHALMRATQAWPDLLDGEVRSVLDRGGAALSDRLPLVARMSACAAATVAAGLLGRTGDVERYAAAGQATTRGCAAKVMLKYAHCLATLHCGSLPEAARIAEDGYRSAIEARVEPLAGEWAGLRGMIARAQGRVHAAQAALRESVVLLARCDRMRIGRVILAELAGAYGMAGDAEQARAWLSRMDEYEAPPGVLLNPWIDRNRAWVAAAELDMAGAVAWSLKTAASARATDQPTIEAAALFDAVRLGAARDVSERLAELARQTAVAGVAVLASVAATLAASDARRADALAQELWRLGYLLPAAEAATAAYRMHARASRRSSGYAALARAREMLSECGGARTPMLDLTGIHAELTERELQVARFAADGCSGQDIADRLGLSRRTVNNHLGRVYAKLGLTGRQDLSELMTLPKDPR